MPRFPPAQKGNEEGLAPSQDCWEDPREGVGDAGSNEAGDWQRAPQELATTWLEAPKAEANQSGDSLHERKRICADPGLGGPHPVMPGKTGSQHAFYFLNA